MMKIFAVIVLSLIMIGCSGLGPRAILEQSNAQTKDAGCVQHCNDTYANCIQNVGYGSSYSTDMKLRRCGDMLSICVDYCPIKNL